MYRLIVKKYGRQYDLRTGKQLVLSLLNQETGKPVNVRYNRKTVSVVYSDGKFTEVYTLPIESWKTIE